MCQLEKDVPDTSLAQTGGSAQATNPGLASMGAPSIPGVNDQATSIAAPQATKKVPTKLGSFMHIAMPILQGAAYGMGSAEPTKAIGGGGFGPAFGGALGREQAFNYQRGLTQFQLQKELQDQALRRLQLENQLQNQQSLEWYRQARIGSQEANTEQRDVVPLGDTGLLYDKKNQRMIAPPLITPGQDTPQDPKALPVSTEQFTNLNTPGALPASTMPTIATSAPAGPQKTATGLPGTAAEFLANQKRQNTPEKTPVPPEQVSGFGNTLAAQYPDLTDAQRKSLVNELGPNPTQADLTKTMQHADTLSAQAETRAATEAARKQAEQDRAASRAQAAQAHADSERDRELTREQAQGTGPLAGVPPHLVAPAAAAATKAGVDYSQAQQASEDMASMVALSKQGNKVAYAYDPVVGVLQINVAGQTKRINTTEIEQYGGAGSALDRIKGYFGKQTQGKSIPDNILNDMQAVSTTYGQNAQKKYQRDLNVVNSTYGSKFQPVTGPTPVAGTAQSSPGGQPKPPRAAGPGMRWEYSASRNQFREVPIPGQTGGTVAAAR